MYSQAWKDILDTVDDFMENAAGCIWFRGHSDGSYPLKSGLFRLDFSGIEQYIDFERKLYTYYKDMGHLLHNNESSWQLLYSLQHHGGKTRLLDWTESFAVAVYFAVCGWKSGNACIWLLKPKELNVLSAGNGEIISPVQHDWPHFEEYIIGNPCNSIAIYPMKNTIRSCTQHGVFTVQGNGMKALDQEFDGCLIGQGYLKAIELHDNIREDALRFIQQNGIHHFSLFPELDGLAKYLNELLLKEH
ncbi:MAG: FRG domain-containing protein [Sporomusaceae bacterium]|nr:FRG domain-containing protein [Sporomusaceae bacterium]